MAPIMVLFAIIKPFVLLSLLLVVIALVLLPVASFLNTPLVRYALLMNLGEKSFYMLFFNMDKSLRHFSKFGCILHVYFPLANYTDSIEAHWFICPYSLKHLNQFSQYGPGLFPSRFIKVTPEFYELEDVDLLNADKETRTFICHNHTDICRILMRNVIVLLAINSSNYFLNL